MEVDLDAVGDEYDLDDIAGGEIDLDDIAGSEVDLDAVADASGTTETDALLGEEEATAAPGISPEELAKASAQNDLESALKSTVVGELESALVLAKGAGIEKSDPIFEEVSERLQKLKDIDKELAAAINIAPDIKHFEPPKKRKELDASGAKKLVANMQKKHGKQASREAPVLKVGSSADQFLLLQGGLCLRAMARRLPIVLPMHKMGQHNARCYQTLGSSQCSRQLRRISRKAGMHS
jgi:hypothetical protein